MDILGTSFRDETGLGGTWFSAPSATLPWVVGLDGGLPFPNRSASGDVGCEEGCLNVLSPRGMRGRGLDRPAALGDWVGLMLAACRARNRSSVAFSRASSSSSSEVCDERAFFLFGATLILWHQYGRNGSGNGNGNGTGAWRGCG